MIYIYIYYVLVIIGFTPLLDMSVPKKILWLMIIFQIYSMMSNLDKPIHQPAPGRVADRAMPFTSSRLRITGLSTRLSDHFKKWVCLKIVYL